MLVKQHTYSHLNMVGPIEKFDAGGMGGKGEIMSVLRS